MDQALTMKQPCVYILSNKKNGVLYIGVTSNLIKRVWEHKNNVVKGFSQKYHLHNLVWFEVHDNMDSAISREKKLKRWLRDWKIILIEKENPEWLDLYTSIC
ncbi:MAG: GIY-YIG nuclease family protein [Methylophagaceae bacterium]